MTKNALETQSMITLPSAGIPLDHCFLSQTPKNRNNDVTGPACWGMRSCDIYHLYVEHTRSVILCVILLHDALWMNTEKSYNIIFILQADTE